MPSALNDYLARYVRAEFSHDSISFLLRFGQSVMVLPAMVTGNYAVARGTSGDRMAQLVPDG